MERNEMIKKIILALILLALLVAVCLGVFPICRKLLNTVDYTTIKEVEDTCRDMIASYNSDWLTYIQYKNSDDKEKQSWAETAKTRANQTANYYNKYFSEHCYVWKDDIPIDIKTELSYLK